MRYSITATLAGLLCVASPAWAIPDDAPAQDSNAVAAVQVDGTRHPELKPYRVMSLGLDAFDEHRSLAPNAPLKFRLWQRDALAGEARKWEGVTLRLAGDQLSMALPIAPDGTFTIPRSKAAYDEDADLVVNRKKSTIGFEARIVTPGLPEDARRMGDLRLECEVEMPIVRSEMNVAQRAFFNTVFLGGDWCWAKRAKIAWLLDDWPMRVTVDDKGAQRTLLASGYRLQVPIQDKSLSDEALVKVESWRKASEQRKREFLQSTPLFLKSSVNSWGAGVPLREVEKGRYVARIALLRGETKVRFESVDGKLALGGAARDGEVGVGAVTGLKYHGGRMVIQADYPGTFEFSLDLREPDQPSLTISRAAS